MVHCKCPDQAGGPGPVQTTLQHFMHAGAAPARALDRASGARRSVAPSAEVVSPAPQEASRGQPQ
eukprot:4307190-Alexandrium_andersonii.AAC.1